MHPMAQEILAARTAKADRLIREMSAKYLSPGLQADTDGRSYFRNRT
jgi:hypothetical protein